MGTLTTGRTRKLIFIPPPSYKGGWWNPSLEFLPSGESLDLLNKMRFILWVVELLEACEVTNNGRHLVRHLGFYQEIRSSVDKLYWASINSYFCPTSCLSQIFIAKRQNLKQLPEEEVRLIQCPTTTHSILQFFTGSFAVNVDLEIICGTEHPSKTATKAVKTTLTLTLTH